MFLIIINSLLFSFLYKFSLYYKMFYYVLEELVLSGHEKYHKTWKDDFEKIIKQFILPSVPCYVLYR